MMLPRALRAPALLLALLLSIPVAGGCASDDAGTDEGGDTGGRNGGRDRNNGGNPDAGGAGDDAANGDDSGTLDPGEDGGPDVVNPGDGTCGQGNILGRVCSPNEQAWIGGATVEIFGTDCDGQPFERETLSDADGNYSFGNVPSGLHQMRVTKGSFVAELPVNVRDGETTDLATSSEKSCLIDDDIEIAVVTGSYDSIGSVLTSVGLTHEDFSDLAFTGASPAEQLLLSPTALAAFDIVMLNCGEHFFFFGMFDTDPTYSRRQIGLNLRNFVLAGGSVYASDLAYFFVEEAFPEMATFSDDESDYEAGLRGAMAEVSATVVDAGLETALGQANLGLHFDLQGWAVAQELGTGAQALVRGDAPLLDGGTITDAPLLITYQPTPTSGRIIYTSFHNHAQLAEDIERVLHHVIFSL